MTTSIFDYMDVHLYLQDFYKFRKSQNPRFSYTTWASELGFNNKTLLRLILQGKRQISAKSRQQFIAWLTLPEHETSYFEALIDYCQAGSTTQRQVSGARLIQLQRRNFLQVPISSESGVLQDVYGPIALTTISSAEPAMKKEDLATSLALNITRVEELVATFLKLGFIEEKDGYLLASQQAFKIPDHFGNQGLRNYYQYWLQRAASAMDLPYEIRRFRSLQIALSPEEFEELTKIFNDFVISLLGRVEKNTLSNRRLYLMNTALFPVTELL